MLQSRSLNLLISHNWNFIPNWTATSSYPQLLGGNHHSIFCFHEFYYLDTWYKWNYEAFHWPNGSFGSFLNMLWKTWMNHLVNPIFVLLWMAYCTYHTVLKVCPCCHIWQDFLRFYGWIILHCMYILYSLYPFIQRWAFDCFYISQSWIMLHWRRDEYIFSRFQFSFFWTNNQKWIAASYGNTIFNYLRKCHVAFYRGYTVYIPNNTVPKCQILRMFTNTFCPF